ncbi:FIST C-terminal domain-containing protein [Patescibacteria group bacterium]|nr:FIST C-terminal domain-containing protein [Patescibacteria group bacterium]
MIKTGVGRSNNPDAQKAGAEAAEQALEKIEGKANLVLIFSSVAYNQEKIIEGVRSVSGISNIPIAGGSPGWGAITNQGAEEGGVVVMALKFEKIKVKVDYVLDLTKDALKAGMVLGKKLKTENKEFPKLVLVFVAGLGVGTDFFLEGIREEIGENASIIGGGTGDEMALKSGGCQFCNSEVLRKGAVGVGFYGDFLIELKAEHGWEPIGLPMKITKAKGILVSEIDKKPAIEIFERYFEKQEIMNPKFFTGEGEGILYPLGIILEKPGRVVVRQVVGATPRGELIFATNMPKGAIVRMMQAQTDKMIEAAAEIGKIRSKLKRKKPQLVFVFDCVTRKALLSPDHQKEIDAFKKNIGEEVPMFGYFSYGEICSKKEEKEWLVHNETFAAALLAE